MPSAGPLPESRFSSWSPSPRSSAATSSRPLTDPPPQEDIVHPLSRPTSQTSFVDHPNREDPASVPPWPQRAPSSSSQLAFYSVSSPHDTSSVPSSPTTTSPALSSYRDMPSFPFLRRANSTTSIPVLPPFVDSTSSLSLFGPSRKLLADPLASASTSDLPSLGSFSRPRSPTPLSGPPAHAPSRTGRALDRGTSAAIGPKAGARLLASREAQRAVRDAELVAAAAAAGQGDDEFSIREQLASGMVRAASPEGLPPAVAPRNVGVAHTASGSSSERLVPRVPVPSLEKEDGHHRREEVRREKPSQESGEQGHHDDKTRAHGRDEGTPRQRPSTSSKAADKGYPSLSSPIRPPRRPPVAGLNAATADSGPSPSPRQRSSSTGSTASLSKDVVLSQLAEAVRREKKKSEMYQRECEQGEKELAEIAGNLEVLKEKFATSLAQQEQVIANLEAEIDELESELEMANDLDEEAAREYLELLATSTSIEAIKVKGPVVGAFDLDALRSSAGTAPSSNGPTAVEKPKRLPFTFRRGLSLKRRVDTHVAAYHTVASNASLPKPSLPARSASVAGAPSAADARPTRPRKLSKSRTTPSVPTISSPIAASEPTPRGPATDGSFAPSGRAPPPPPAPVFPASKPWDLPFELQPRRPPRESPPKQRQTPPVAGVSRSRLFGGGGQGSVTDSEREDGGVKGRADPSSPVSGQGHGNGSATRPRKRSFKEGVQGTMRMLFPAHSTASRTGGARAGSPPGGESVQQWLQRGMAEQQQELHR
ncbi:hypothetical protein DMC30DRAFT_39557 [Rhodotorula diobovata]|uniref:Uncharacterized protein n=1 Tax=Rhodotorula diobovata TaxID=5288 RepID=A0A5C5FPF0_9BASI|nr:hypothetical protein DMC30DRAFT_39557 [Rhodotorula diobovata]